MSIFTRINNITTTELEQKLKQDPSIKIIDVRVPERYQKEHIPNVPNIPWKQIKQGHYQPTAEKTYIICHSGVDSRKSTKKLTAKGYNVVNVLGGMLDWHGPVTSEK